MASIIDRLYQDHLALSQYLDKAGEVSLRNAVDADFRKVLYLSAASFFETELTQAMVGFAEKRSGDERVAWLLKRRALDRQFFKFFKWESSNVNVFLSSFGDGFRAAVGAEIQASADLRSGMVAFLHIGNTRNELVHLNFAAFPPIEKTPAEIFALYEKAVAFIEFIKKKLV